MQRVCGLFLILAGTASVALAGLQPAPEIDPATAASALAVLTGAVLIIRARRKRSPRRERSQ